jgi:hypothetical protein
MPEDQKHFTITLDSFDVGQLLDGLRIRAESWRKTAEFIESGYADETFVCEECNNADEASRIAQHYERVITEMERQIDEQGGW